MTDQTALLLAAGQTFLQRWQTFLRDNPDFDRAAVTQALASGELPPETEALRAAKKTAAADRRSDIAARLDSVLSDLTPLQRRFIIEFLSQVRPNARAAYIAAGGTAKHPARAAYQMRNLPAVKTAIDEYFYTQEMGAREAVARLSEQARADYAAYLLPGGQVNLTRLLADGKGHLIKSFKHTQHGLNIEFYDGQQALDKVLRYHGLLTSRVDANLSTRDDGLTVDEWKETAANRRQEAAATAALFAGDEEE